MGTTERGAFRSWIRNWEGTVLWDEPLSKHTSLRVGGPCDAMVFPRDLSDLQEVLRQAQRHEEPLLVLGRGTNLLVRDGGIRGTVINLRRGRMGIDFRGDRATVEAGGDLFHLAAGAARKGLAGLEFAWGIPGTVGGGIRGNAGAFGSCMGRVLEKVRLFDWGGDEHVFLRREIDFGYRRCFLPQDGVIVEAEFALRPDDPARVQERTADLQRERRRSQPLQAMTAGSVFKNPPQKHAGQVIESLGLKGRRMGGARISEAHANFIENLGRAQAADVLALIALIQERAEKELQVPLELEIQVVGEG